jgi:hypothetical protein
MKRKSDSTSDSTGPSASTNKDQASFGGEGKSPKRMRSSSSGDRTNVFNEIGGDDVTQQRRRILVLELNQVGRLPIRPLLDIIQSYMPQPASADFDDPLIGWNTEDSDLNSVWHPSLSSTPIIGFKNLSPPDDEDLAVSMVHKPRTAIGRLTHCVVDRRQRALSSSISAIRAWTIHFMERDDADDNQQGMAGLRAVCPNYGAEWHDCSKSNCTHGFGVVALNEQTGHLSSRIFVHHDFSEHQTCSRVTSITLLLDDMDNEDNKHQSPPVLWYQWNTCDGWHSIALDRDISSRLYRPAIELGAPAATFRIDSPPEHELINESPQSLPRYLPPCTHSLINED